MLNPEFVQGGPRKISPPSVLHVFLAIVLISVFTLCYGPGLLFRGPFCRIQNSTPGFSQSASPERITKYFTASQCIIKSNPKLIFCAVGCNTSKHDDRLHNVILPMSDLTAKTRFFFFAFRRAIKFIRRFTWKTHTQMGKIQCNSMLK
jgi:hypothetical protein